MVEMEESRSSPGGSPPGRLWLRVMQDESCAALSGGRLGGGGALGRGSQPTAKSRQVAAMCIATLGVLADRRTARRCHEPGDTVAEGALTRTDCGRHLASRQIHREKSGDSVVGFRRRRHCVAHHVCSALCILLLHVRSTYQCPRGESHPVACHKIVTC